MVGLKTPENSLKKRLCHASFQGNYQYCGLLLAYPVENENLIISKKNDLEKP